MTSDESVASVVKQVIDRFGRIDVLVNDAARQPLGTPSLPSQIRRLVWQQ